jgi:hypothetical protein
MERLTLVPVAGILLSIIGCASQAHTEKEEIVEFNNVLISAIKRINQSGFDFGIEIGRELEKPAKDDAKLQAALMEHLRTIEKSKEAARSLKVPNSKAARELYQAYQLLLDNQEKTFKTFGPSLIELIVDENLGKGDKDAKVKEIIQRGHEIEMADAEKVMAAQKALVKEQDVKLTLISEISKETDHPSRSNK